MPYFRELQFSAQKSESRKVNSIGKYIVQAFHRHHFQRDPSTKRPSTISPKQGSQRAKISSKSRRNRTKCVEQATREAHVEPSCMEQYGAAPRSMAHTAPSCVEQYGAAPRNTMLREALYKYGLNFEREGRQLVER